MMRRHLIVFTIVPVLLCVVAIGLMWFAAELQDAVQFREAKYPALEARARALDQAAKILHGSDVSATDLARIIIASEDIDRGHIQFLTGLALILAGLAGLQLLFIILILHRAKRAAPRRPS